MNSLGIDIGSSSIKAVLLDGSLRLIEHRETANRGDPASAFRGVISDIIHGPGNGAFHVGVTGSGRDIIRATSEIFLMNEILSLAVGASHFHPHVRSVIEIGAQASRWVLLDEGEFSASDPGILDFALNEMCAAGSGAFLVQQAARLKLGIEEFSDLAAAAKKGAAVAGRCSVFAKTDMIHLQQKGTPVEEIAYGVCLALARNFVATVLKGREAFPQILLAGGGARNRGLVRAFRKILGHSPGGWVVPKAPQLLGAMGAAAGASLAVRQARISSSEELLQFLVPQRSGQKLLARPLGPLEISLIAEPAPGEEDFIEGYLGVDVGSVSTNLVLVDRTGKVRAGVYLPTRGRPIEMLREGYGELEAKCPAGFDILGIGTTGSGRHLAGKLLRADSVHNEITCQLRSAAHFFPEVDTVFEIGGQDSKFIRANEGRIEDFAMNKVCAAGTGSFLEEQAEILGIRINEEFSRLASQSSGPSDLGSRCTVFMDSELTDAVSRGVPASDIAAGLAYSIAHNYLEKVVDGRSIGQAIVFQGGVASNPAVVRAFALKLGREIRVHPHNRISGAIGAALIAGEKVERSGKESPGAASVAQRLREKYSVTSFTCTHCSNRCHVNKIALEDESVFFGDTCERYTAGQDLTEAPASPSRTSARPALPNLFKERQDLAGKSIDNPTDAPIRIGIPMASVLREYLPFWATFFNGLGAAVVVSPNSNSEILEIGLQKLPAETCLPIKIAFGHIGWFADKDVDRVFFPSLIDPHRNPKESVSVCPYSENFPFMAMAATQTKLLSPSINMNGSAEDFIDSLGDARDLFGRGADEIRASFEKAVSAQEAFAAALRSRGREIFERLQGPETPVWAILGRPYTLHDPFLNLNLGRHLEKLGIVGLPLEFLPFDGWEGLDWPGAPHWRYNQQALMAAHWCSSKPGIRPVVLTNFGCGLDAFNMRHILEIVAGKSHLVLEFDEHRAEAGLITRLEAFLDEADADPGVRVSRNSTKAPRRPLPRGAEEYRSRKFVLPYFADHVYGFSGAFKGVGIETDVLPLPDEATVLLGEQHSTGKECHAYSIIAGDFVKFSRSARIGNEVFYFPGTKYACVLNQYDKGLNYLAGDLGIADIEAIAPGTDFLSQLLGMKGLKLLWQGVVSIDLLVRTSCAVRPYELRKGATDRVHKENLEDIEAGLAAGDVGPALKRCTERLKSVPVRKEKRPVVGIAGDIYTRNNPVANHGLFLRLEELGCEVRPSSFFVDDVDFGLGRDLRRKMSTRRYGKSSIVGLLYLRKELERLKVRKSLERAVPIHKDPTFKDIIRFSSPYIGLENNQVLLLNLAKMVEFAEHGADGIINAICFNCMLGTVSAAIAGRIRKNYDNIPIPTFIYAGSELSTEKTKLEAFVYQVKKNAGRRGR